MSLLADETVGEFMLENSSQVGGDAGQSLHRDADAAVVDGAGPTGGAGDVRKTLLGIKDDADGLGRSEIELRFNAVEASSSARKMPRAKSGVALPLYFRTK